ncbi:MAG: vanadium-dependent haloperoxidase [Candidatus Eisenbacteria bacterium]|nr:vanadium-dependent haloperoxidase [Candidatus Eisenbacteria bacterium]
MSNRHWLSLVLCASLLFAGCSDDDSDPIDPTVPAGSNVVIQWNQVAIQAIRDARPGPPQAARALAIVHTAMYDAWAAYDERAVGTMLGDNLRRPSNEYSAGRKSMAISYAAFRALSDQYPTEVMKFRTRMSELGYDPDDNSIDTTMPAGVGNTASAAIIAFRHFDGANQLGDLATGAYGDYTGYVAHNPAIRVDVPTPLASIPFPSRWQPLTFENAAGATVSPGFICPHWGRVVPFALTSPGMLRPPAPASITSTKFRQECEELITMSANLTNEQKAIAEYWADGPSSELPPGHFNLFAQWISDRDDHTLDQDVRLFFALTNAVFDAGIAVWDAKAVYDSCRPITGIRYLYNGQTIRAWGGPGQGTVDMDGAAWRPYQPSFFPTPPFAEYTSGHSAFSAAAAEVLKRFTGSDLFGFTWTFTAGSSKVEPGIAPSVTVSRTLGTFSEAADEAGISRRYGGIHYEEGDLVSRTMGRQSGVLSWSKANALWAGYDVNAPASPLASR